MRYVTLLAALTLLGTTDTAIAQQQHNIPTRAGAPHRTAERTVMAPRESLNESVTRLAVRGTSPKPEVARKELLGLYLLLATTPSRPSVNTEHN